MYPWPSGSRSKGTAFETFIFAYSKVALFKTCLMFRKISGPSLIEDLWLTFIRYNKQIFKIERRHLLFSENCLPDNHDFV